MTIQTTTLPPLTRQRALVYLVIAALGWSSSGLFVKLISWGPLTIWGGRSIFTAIVLLIYLRQMPRRFSRMEVFGAVGYMGAQFFFIAGNKVAPAANIIFLASAVPFFLIPLVGYSLLKERPARADWVATATIFAGMALFFGDDLSLEGFRGNFFGLLSGISVSIMILGMRAQKDATPAHSILLGSIIGGVIGIPLLVQAPFSPVDLSMVIFLGIFQLGVPFILYSTAIKVVPAMEATIIGTLEPIFNPLWVFLVLSEVPGKWAFLGGVLVVLAIIGRSLVSIGDETQ